MKWNVVCQKYYGNYQQHIFTWHTKTIIVTSKTLIYCWYEDGYYAVTLDISRSFFFSVTSQKTWIFNKTAVEISNLVVLTFIQFKPSNFCNYHCSIRFKNWLAVWKFIQNCKRIQCERGISLKWIHTTDYNPYPTAFPYGNGMVLHFYQQQESSTTKTVHKVINKRLKAYV